MANIDITQFSEFRKVFPELTAVQFETAMLFSLGISQKEIATLRAVSYPVVNETLEEIKVKMHFCSLSNLLSVFQIRLVFFALRGGVLKKRTETRQTT
ncbi:transcriptional regulator [Candidatus Regiella endosymbiont of Tuberolachnus salignus]|uniref:transcriptional regulator n=1 Tax=Candidatus Regiella endosymbiont of Tuberolachnus salignus TaxID=3077956 RepID=UPI0030D4DC2F